MNVKRMKLKIAGILIVAIALLMGLMGVGARADSLFPISLQSHYISLSSVPTSTTAVYSTGVWLKAIELIPQSSTSPTCTVQDGLGNYLYHAVQLQPNISYRDTRQDTAPLYASGGITWSCSDSTVKAQLIVMY
jgi:hypothetical protein